MADLPSFSLLPGLRSLKLRDGQTDAFIETVQTGDAFSLEVLGSCLAIQVELNVAATSLRYDWTPPGGTETAASHWEINEPFCWPTETGWAFPGEIADCGCSAEMSQRVIP
jgi:hypothetical protein